MWRQSGLAWMGFACASRKRVPTATITSARGNTARPPRPVSASGWLEGMRPRAPSVMTTGACIRSASSTRAAPASAAAAPPPACITGNRAARSRRAASCSVSSRGASRSSGARSCNEASALCCSTSGGSSIATGRGIPERNRLNASWTRSGTSSADRAMPCHLVRCPRISPWPRISCNRPQLPPMAGLGICPAMNSVRALQA